MKLKLILSILLLIFINVSNLSAYSGLNSVESDVLSFWWDNKCENIKESDIPTIFIPWILASWYSEEWYKENKIKRRIPDPVTHSYDTLFYAFAENWYDLKDVFYKDEFNTYIEWNPKKSLYLFWYDWKKDNKITAKLLANLIFQIREKYESVNWCDIWTVNIIAHSMWWLVARAMLEDMCASDEEILNYYNLSTIQEWKLKVFSSNKCNYTKINRLVTISTPQRWAPSSFPMWTKWDIRRTDALFKSVFLKWQLWVSLDEEIYKLIHWYDTRALNGIVTIWQLLPDIKNYNSYNKELNYLYQYDNKLNNNVHPVNNFLEELNREENIDKMFSNIDKEYNLYYSSLTWNDNKWFIWNKNNTVWFDISSSYKENWYIYDDATDNYKWKGLDSFYSEIPKRNIYNINDNIRNEKWFWWDWTVASNNLLLSYNDDLKIIKNDKLKIKKIQCYNNDFFEEFWYDLKNIENVLSKKIWTETLLELCSHAKMPMITSIYIINEVANLWFFEWLKEVEIVLKEQELLYKYLWYANYWSIYEKSNAINSYDTDLVWSSWEGSLDLSSAPEIKYSYEMWWIKNSDKLNERFSNWVFNTIFKDKNEIDYFISNKDKDYVDWKSLEMSWKLWTVTSLLRYEVLSPINLIIEDEQWRKIWIDPNSWLIINEIPWAWTSWNTEWSNEPEFFLIPRTSTWQILHKIHSYPTGEWEYEIVMNEIKYSNEDENILDEIIIDWVAKEWIIENYIVWIEWNKSWYKKIDDEVSSILKKSNNSRKYADILRQIYFILDTKYTNIEKTKLKDRLIKLKWIDYGKFKDNEKIIYLIWNIIDYLDK